MITKTAIHPYLKFCCYLLLQRYQAIGRLGVATDTLDALGSVTQQLPSGNYDSCMSFTGCLYELFANDDACICDPHMLLI